MNSFQLLLKRGVLGFYNSFEMTHAFILDKKEKKVYNFFTIFVAEERSIEIEEKKELTENLIKINKQFSFGCFRKQIDLNLSEDIFNRINNNNLESKIDFGEGILETGLLKKISKQFVPQDSTESVSLNKILKNNFRNGSYLLEFFDVSKPIDDLLSKNEIKKTSEELLKIVPIDLVVMTDRIGNIIFQIPSSICNFGMHGDKNEDRFHINLQFDERIKDKSNYELVVETKFDDEVIGFGKNNKLEENFILAVGDTTRTFEPTIYDNKNKLIISKTRTALMRTLKMDFFSNSGYRTVDLQNGNIKKIEVKSLSKSRTNEPNDRKWEDFIDTRQYKERTDKLQNRKEFLQYGDKFGDREKALNDIRHIMDSSNGGPVYLWDPYLSGEDLLATWYYTSIYNTKLKAITSNIFCNKEISLNEWYKTQQIVLKKGSNQYGINIEFRCQHDNFGYKFHDRFLMIQNDDGLLKAWSLGASINSIGDKHHIIQLVQHPRQIIDSFENLWEELNDPSCVIWNNGEPK